jgi:hypothetical protein
MMMKTLYTLIAIILLSGCARYQQHSTPPLTPEENAAMARSSACWSLAEKMPTEKDIYHQCKDDPLFDAHFPAILSKAPYQEVCALGGTDGMPAALDAIRKRHLTKACFQLLVDSDRQIVKSSPNSSLCEMWANREMVNNQFGVQKMIDQEVRERGVNCTEENALTQQQQIANQQLQLQRAQALATYEQNQALINAQQQAAWNANRPRSTNCNTVGGYTNCTSY